MNRKILITLFFASILISACVPVQTNIATDPTKSVGEIVQATFQSLTAQPALESTEASTPEPLSTDMPVENTGSISGVVKSKFIHVVAFLKDTDQYYSVDLQGSGANDYIFTIENLPAGVYRVFAFTSASPFAAPFPSAYSNYVKCGLRKNCTDHSLVDVTVIAGQKTGGVYILDTVGAPEFTPYIDLYFADKQNGQTSSGADAATLPFEAGDIGGDLAYDETGIPVMFVVAFRKDGAPNEFYFKVAEPNITSYGIYNLPVGKYQIVAYTLGGDLGNGSFYPELFKAGFTQYVKCGMVAPCANHELIEVEIKSGEYTKADPLDWLAPQESMPSFPLP